jgi:hypothetical protein
MIEEFATTSWNDLKLIRWDIHMSRREESEYNGLEKITLNY